MGLSPTHSMVETPSRAFYREAMDVLSRAGIPFLVGGAFAFVHQAGIDHGFHAALDAGVKFLAFAAKDEHATFVGRAAFLEL